MSNVRLRQMVTQKTQPTAARAAFTKSDACTLPQFLSAHESQGFSYAAAVRRSPNRVCTSPWIDSRSSSPTTGLSAKLSLLQLGSKGSSPSSTTSESTSERERERPLSAGAIRDRRRNSYFGNTLTVAREQGRGQAWTNTRGGYVHNKTSKTSRQPGRPRSNSYSVTSQNRPPMIPGILSVTENPSEDKEGAKSSDGGWIKVERQKRLPRQDNKQVRGRQRRGGRGGRGAGGRTYVGHTWTDSFLCAEHVMHWKGFAYELCLLTHSKMNCLFVDNHTDASAWPTKVLFKSEMNPFCNYCKKWTIMSFYSLFTFKGRWLSTIKLHKIIYLYLLHLSFIRFLK